mmetsp:Transcript_31086/g.55661  ORF Transcript_31086/g.55661 Transcript_31086/m.55661 type:complete len:264 (+) Transcript_31086:76-867(+)
MMARNLSEEPAAELADQLLLGSSLQPLMRALEGLEVVLRVERPCTFGLADEAAAAGLCAGQDVAAGRRSLQQQLWESSTARLEAEGVDHVSVGILRPVLLAAVHPLLGVPSVAVGAVVVPETPFVEGHRLHVHELVRLGSSHDVGVADSSGIAVGGDLHRGAVRQEDRDGPEEELHQVLVAPAHEGVRVEESRDGPRVREVVVGRAEAAFQSAELRVVGQPRAVHSVPHLGTHLAQLPDRIVDLRVALTQRFDGLEGRGDQLP